MPTRPEYKVLRIVCALVHIVCTSTLDARVSGWMEDLNKRPEIRHIVKERPSVHRNSRQVM